MHDQTGELGDVRSASFICVSTVRRDGREVRTPVGPLWDGDRLFFYTPDHSGKVKRIRNNPAVRVAACTRAGVVEGPWLDATATIVTGPQAEAVAEQFRQKWGLSYAILRRVEHLRGIRRAVVELTPRAA